MRHSLHHQLQAAHSSLLKAYIGYLHIYIQIIRSQHAENKEFLVQSITSVRIIAQHLRLLLPLSQDITEHNHKPVLLQKKNTDEKK